MFESISSVSVVKNLNASNYAESVLDADGKVTLFELEARVKRYRTIARGRKTK